MNTQSGALMFFLRLCLLGGLCASMAQLGCGLRPPATPLAVASPTAAVPTITPLPGFINPTPTPTPPPVYPTTLSLTISAAEWARLQQLARAVGQRLQQQNHWFSTYDECEAQWTAGRACSVYDTTIPLLRTEWATLLPNTAFFLVRARVAPFKHAGSTNPNDFVVALQKEQLYQAEDFAHLLETNKIEVTEANQELVAKSFALMTLGLYLAGDVVFTDAKPTNDSVGIFKFNYEITAHTQILGRVFGYAFFYETGKIGIATGAEITKPSVAKNIITSDYFFDVRFQTFTYYFNQNK